MTLSKQQIEAELRLMLEDPVYALKVLLPHWFPDRIPWFHRGIIAILTQQVDFLERYGELDKIFKYFQWKEDPWDKDSPSVPMFSRDESGHIKLTLAPFTLIMLPRGFSKTTLLNGVNLYSTLFVLHKFIVYISHASPHAEMQLKNLKDELKHNTVLLSIFGNLVPGNTSGLSWTSDLFQTTNGVTFAARGKGGQIRGMNVRGDRPTLLLFDDVEDRESVSTEDQRLKTKQWFYRDAIPALAKRNSKAAVVVLGTLLNNDSLLVTLSRDPRFNTVVFGATDEEGEALWPEHVSLEKLEVEKQAAIRAGDLSGYYMEYYNQVRGGDNAKFTDKMFRYEPWVADDDYMVAMAIDPAISEKPGADFTSIAVVAMHLKKGHHYVLECWCKQGAKPREQVDKYFELSKKWKVKHHGVEAIAYQSALVHFLREEMFRQKHYFEITEIKHANKKDERILGILQPRYANGYIIHTKRFPILESQLLDYPNGKKDAPDALSMAITLLDPYAAAAADPSMDLGDDEYAPLDEVYRGEWRRF